MEAHRGPKAASLQLSGQQHPLEGPWTLGNAASRMRFSWVRPLLRKGISGALTEEDVWRVPSRLRTKEVGLQAQELWRLERALAAKAQRPPRLLPVLLRLTGKDIAAYTLSSMAAMVCFIVAPFAQREFLTGFQGNMGRDALAAVGFIFMLCWFGIALAVTICKAQGQVAGQMARTAVQHLIYSTCLAMTLDATAGCTNPNNLMSVDAERFFTVLNVTMPHCFVLMVVFPVMLIAQLGAVPAVGCVMSTVGAAMIQKWIGGRISGIRRQVMAEADRRLQLTEQFLEGIRVLKMNAWTRMAREQLAEVRGLELRHHRRMLLWKGINLMFGLASASIVGFCMIVAYVLLGGRMEPEVIFPALTILRALQMIMGDLPSAFSAYAEFVTALKRVQGFVSAFSPRGPPNAAVRGGGLDGEVLFQKATFLRTSGADGSEKAAAEVARSASARSFKLGPVDLRLHPGELCIVCGPVGSGKSTLLLGMLGELALLADGGRVEAKGRMALCGQEPWIFSATIRENVRCFRPAAARAYEAAVCAAQLPPDMSALPAADETEIGSRGINISGGQKARVALARAAFGAAEAKIVLLDDVLSAVDAHVARQIVAEVLLGVLHGCTRVLVANTFLPLLLPHADRVVVLSGDGRVEVVGPPKAALTASMWLREAVETMGGCNLDVARPPDAGGETGSTGAVCPVKGDADTTGPNSAGSTLVGTPSVTTIGPAAACGAVASPPTVDGSLLVAEEHTVGILSGRAYAAYFREVTRHRSTLLGGATFAAVVLLVALAEACRSGTELLITLWSRQEAARAEEPTSDLPLWISVYALLILGMMAISVTRTAIFTRAVVAIGGRTHDRILRQILGASVPLFFDIVPMGRILNRFSTDVDVIDSQLPDAMSEFLQAGAYILAIVGMCAMAAYQAALVLLPLILLAMHARRLFGATSRELKRLEAISRSPLYDHFQETVCGLLHIRAFGLKERMLEEFEAKADRNLSLFYHQNILIPWLVYRMNLNAAALVGMVVVVAVCFRRTMDPALIGLGLASGAGLLGRLHTAVRCSVNVESYFTSVERLDHFQRVPQEEGGGASSAATDAAGAAMAAALPPAAWPERGELVFEAVQVRYRPHLPPVLGGASFRVPAGHRAGLVGRTGSGKSTCMLALLRVVEPAGGRILLDRVDLASLPLDLLRGHAVSIIPQEPYLFAGTLYENLDPFGMADTSACENALQSAGLTWGGGLDMRVEVRGANLSVGQRQLVCIARAMLRGARVVLMDEASASIDANTDAHIQRSIRRCFKGSTLLIIAHRLSSVADADLLICMDQGRVVEVGPPAELRRAGGAVAKMFADAGDLRPEKQASGIAPSGRQLHPTPDCCTSAPHHPQAAS